MDRNEETGIELTRSREEREEKSAKLHVEELSAVVVDAAFHLHTDLGPGLLESVYEAILARLLRDRGLSVVRQLPVPIEFAGLRLDEGFRADLVINDLLVIELKSVEQLAPGHAKQLLTYLRLMHLPLGLLINFGAATFKEGVKRIANNHRDFAASRLRVNQIVTEQEGSREAATLGSCGPHHFV
jgi:iron complex transport system substrate-binding protein